jgi:hypothetical protein
LSGEPHRFLILWHSNVFTLQRVGFLAKGAQQDLLRRPA